MNSKYPPDNIRFRTAIAYSRKRILLLCLMSTSIKSAGVPNIDLSGERMLKTKLRKYRGKDGIPGI